jgi:hypothetical protein
MAAAAATQRRNDTHLPDLSGKGLSRNVDQSGEMYMAKKWFRAAAMTVCMGFAAVCGSAFAQEIPIVTGELWTQSSEQVKKAYLVGIANAIQTEVAYEGANPPPDAQSIVPRLAKGLRGQTLDSVREGLDKFYTTNPDKLKRPVIETIWFEMVVPGLKK